MPARTFQVITLGLALVGCSADVDDLFNDEPGGSPATGGDGQGGDGAGSNVGASGAGPSDGGGPSTTNTTGEGAGPSRFCGDGVIGDGEACDGADLGGASCADAGFTNPAGASCDEQCDLDFGACAPTCDGVALEPGETCDGSDLGGIDCTDFSYENPGGATCTPDCSAVDASFCQPVCGNGVTEPDELCDGSQLAVDCTDYGFSQPTAGEPSCTFFCDVDPSECEGTCGDGVVEPDEGCDDGNAASNDGCSAGCLPEGIDCVYPIQVDLALGQVVHNGDTTNGGTVSDTSDDRCAAGAAGRSRTYAVNVLEDGFLTAWIDRTGTAFNSVLYAQTSCGDDATTVLCADNNPQLAMSAVGGELISFPVSQGAAIYLVVDSASSLAQGAYALTIDLSTGSTCQDPIPLPVWSGTPMTVLGDTTNQTQSTGGTCGGGGMGNGATDVVYRVDRRSSSVTSMSFGLPPELTSYDSVLYGRFDCTGNEITCDDDPSAPAGGEQISMAFMNNNIRHVWVDGFNGADGPYGMVITPAP